MNAAAMSTENARTPKKKAAVVVVVVAAETGLEHNT